SANERAHGGTSVPVGVGGAGRDGKISAKACRGRGQTETGDSQRYGRTGDQSTLMFAARATVRHLSFCAAMNAANSCGVPSGDTAPSLAMVSRISGVLSPSFRAPLSLLTIAGGVPPGATMPLKVITS